MIRVKKVRAPTDIVAEQKAIFKKQIRDKLEANTKLNKFLEENHAKGRFIKNLTERALRGRVYSIANINSTDPINSCLLWDNTTEGWSYWNNLHDKYREQH